MRRPAPCARPWNGERTRNTRTHGTNGTIRPVHSSRLRRCHGRPSSFLLGLNQPGDCQVEFLTATPRQSWAILTHLRGDVAPSSGPDSPAGGPESASPATRGQDSRYFPFQPEMVPLPARAGIGIFPAIGRYNVSIRARVSGEYEHITQLGNDFNPRLIMRRRSHPQESTVNRRFNPRLAYEAKDPRLGAGRQLGFQSAPRVRGEGAFAWASSTEKLFQSAPRVRGEGARHVSAGTPAGFQSAPRVRGEGMSSPPGDGD